MISFLPLLFLSCLSWQEGSKMESRDRAAFLSVCPSKSCEAAVLLSTCLGKWPSCMLLAALSYLGKGWSINILINKTWKSAATLCNHLMHCPFARLAKLVLYKLLSVRLGKWAPHNGCHCWGLVFPLLASWLYQRDVKILGSSTLSWKLAIGTFLLLQFQII